MNKKICVITVLAILAVVLASLIIWKSNNTTLTAAQKEKIEDAYKLEWFGIDPNNPSEDDLKAYERLPFIWFEENGGNRDLGVFRYFGTYGDCVVLLQYGDGYDDVGTPIESPTIDYLSRPLECPMECEIVLYNKNPNYPPHKTLAAPIAQLSHLTWYKISWLTDGQLEQLTDDLEKWIEEGNY